MKTINVYGSHVQRLKDAVAHKKQAISEGWTQVHIAVIIDTDIDNADPYAGYHVVYGEEHVKD